MENKWLIEQFAQAGETAGRAYAVFYQAFLDGFTDQYGCPRPPSAPEATEDDAQGGICARCWCDTCANVDECDAFPSGDGIRPPPCAACPQDATVPLMPRDTPAECGTYKKEDTPKDCKACWCEECGALDDCTVKKDGFDPNSDIFPCDGCRKGQRYMPKENPPYDKFTKRGIKQKQNALHPKMQGVSCKSLCHKSAFNLFIIIADLWQKVKFNAAF